MANNIPQFENELFQLLNTTTNLDAATKTELSDAVNSAYLSEWLALVASGTPDTAANRGRFVARKITRGFLSSLVRAFRRNQDITALPDRGGLE